jgi:hypothetical protein
MFDLGTTAVFGFLPDFIRIRSTCIASVVI